MPLLQRGGCIVSVASVMLTQIWFLYPACLENWIVCHAWYWKGVGIVCASIGTACAGKLAIWMKRIDYMWHSGISMSSMGLISHMHVNAFCDSFGVRVNCKPYKESFQYIFQHQLRWTNQNQTHENLLKPRGKSKCTQCHYRFNSSGASYLDFSVEQTNT